MGRFNFMDPAIASRTGLALHGLAVTIRCRPGDNLMVHKALEIALPGDVLVVDTCGNTGNAVFGELMGRVVVARKLGGIVVDGAIRDVAGLRTLGLPAFSRTVSPGACDKDGPGEINLPVSCGGVAVMPGDVIVGDADGVAVVPQAVAEEVWEGVKALVERERKRVAEIESGTVFKPDVDQTLRQHGIIP
jgi:regulator of RNase E activity RraA